MSPSIPALTICTVSYQHRSFLELNYRLSKRLNEQDWGRVEWRVAENAPKDKDNRVENGFLGFQVHAGSANTSNGISYHHADGLKLLLNDIRSRYLLILDPDYFLLRKNWVSDVLEHMDRRGLSFFGTPWNPRYIENYRYFPSVHCMFIDLSRVDRERLDFYPDLQRLEILKAFTSDDWGPFNFIRHRQRVCWDTGVSVFEQFSRLPAHKVECTIPVLRPSGNHSDITRPSFVGRILNRVLPERYTYLPKRSDSYSLAGFKELGINSIPLPNLWEESLWRGEAFGLHIRKSFSAEKRNQLDELALCREVLASFASRLGVVDPSLEKDSDPIKNYRIHMV